MITQHSLRRVFGALAVGLCVAIQPLLAHTASSQQQKPNILFILADNIGYGDIGIYGGGELRGAPKPRIDQLAAEGLRLTQFLVEPACTPSRAALMTGQYSIRSGLSLVAVEGTSISLPANEITMAEMLRDAGYATAIFGKWHLSGEPYSQPQNKGFDAFYGIPPAVTWDAFLMIPQGRQTKTFDIPLDKGPQIVEAKRGEPLKVVKPYTAEVRREIDWELVDHGVDFMKRQKAAGKPFFLYLPISRTHFPNLPSKRFEGASRIGQFGDSLMEGDAIVGRMLDALDELGLARDTIVVFASDNGPDGPGARPFGGLVAARWKQFRFYFADVAPGRSGEGGATLMGGVGTSAAAMNGYPKVFNIESDPHEEHNIGEMYEWVIGPALKAVEEYKASLAKSPNPPAANITRF
jgi:arylsulfatase A-like enzyme